MAEENMPGKPTPSESVENSPPVSPAEANAVKKTEPSIPSTIEERSLAGAAYIPLLGFLITTLKPKSKFCSFHGNQGVVLTILLFLVIFWLVLESSLLGIAITGSLAFLGWFALSVAAAVRSFQGDVWKIPIIGTIAEKIDLNKIMNVNASVSEKKQPVTATTTKIETATDSSNQATLQKTTPSQNPSSTESSEKKDEKTETKYTETEAENSKK